MHLLQWRRNTYEGGREYKYWQINQHSGGQYLAGWTLSRKLLLILGWQRARTQSSFDQGVCGKDTSKLEAQWAEPVSLTFHSALRKLNTEPFHRCFPPNCGSFGKAVSEKKIFRNRPTRNKNCLWQPCLLTDRDIITNLYNVPSIYVSYKVSVHLAKRFQRRKFLEIDQSEKRIACGGHVCAWIGTTWAIVIEDRP
jgi:hypothetical protein